jgi:hypothetical protein
MAELTLISWREIPAQVVARAGRRSARAELPARFQEAIDAAAMRAGLIGSDDYLGQWRRESRPCGDDLESEVAAEVARLEAAYDDDRLAALARAGGAAGREEDV